MFAFTHSKDSGQAIKFKLLLSGQSKYTAVVPHLYKTVPGVIKYASHNICTWCLREKGWSAVRVLHIYTYLVHELMHVAQINQKFDNVLYLFLSMATRCYSKKNIWKCNNFIEIRLGLQRKFWVGYLLLVLWNLDQKPKWFVIVSQLGNLKVQCALLTEYDINEILYSYYIQLKTSLCFCYLGMSLFLQ